MMSPSEFVMLIDLYSDVVVDFKEYENTNKLQYITIDFLNSDDPREIYCEIVADFKDKTAHIHHVLSMSADQMLKVSYIMKILYEYLERGVY